MVAATDAISRWREAKGQCINPRCTSKGRRRRARTLGLCQACDMALRRKIDAGVITREQAVERGLCLPKGRHAKSRFDV